MSFLTTRGWSQNPIFRQKESDEMFGAFLIIVPTLGLFSASMSEKKNADPHVRERFKWWGVS
jgi:hypothetical protein